MRSGYSRYLYALIAIGTGAITSVPGAGGHSESSLWLAVVASLALTVLATKSGSGFNTPPLVVFAVFHVSYGDLRIGWCLLMAFQPSDGV